MVRQAEHRRPDEIVRSGWPLTDDVVAVHRGGVAVGIGRRDADSLEDPDGGVRAVDGLTTLENGPDHVARPRHPCAGRLVELDVLTAAGDAHHLVAVEIASREPDRHAALPRL